MDHEYLLVFLYNIERMYLIQICNKSTNAMLHAHLIYIKHYTFSVLIFVWRSRFAFKICFSYSLIISTIQPY